MKIRNLLMLAASAAACAPAFAGTFDGGIPAAWQCTGNCGTSAADGVVPLAPGGGSEYGWISTDNSASHVSLPGIIGNDYSQNGSILRSVSFNAAAGAALDVRFDFVTSDGGQFGDYAWGRLLDAGNKQVAVLFTARTTPDGATVPGFDLPAPKAALSPFPVPIMPGLTAWAPLGPDSGRCYDVGCGTTDWISAQYAIASAGIYRLEFGVANWVDGSFASGLAVDAITLDGAPLPVPEPGQYAMVLAGLALFGSLMRFAR